MIVFDYIINFAQGSLNTDKYFNIYHDDKILAKKVTLPHKISFDKWRSEYNIVVENDNCGSRKNIRLNGQSTTINFTTQLFPTTNPILVIPITTVRPNNTTLTTSTTTKLPKSVHIDTINVTKCETIDNIIIGNTILKFAGNYSGKLLIQIKNFDTNFIVRKFDGGIVEKNEFEINLPIGQYQFKIKDATDESIEYILTTSLNCPIPTFDVEYIPNTCGQIDSKIRIYNIRNANKFRYCFGETFFCNNMIDNPDGVLEENSTEVIINLNAGKLLEYTHGEYIVIRGFNNIETDFNDVKIELTPCVKSDINDTIYVTCSYKNLRVDEKGSNVRISINLLQNGKKINAPTDISVNGYYITSINGAYVQQKFNTVIFKNNNVSIINKVLDSYSEIYDSCIENIEPTNYLGIRLQNNSPCT
jgi:hypothetical protein